jgi:hypothetical protein
MIENNSMTIVSVVKCYGNTSNSLMIENRSKSQHGACNVNLIVFI